MQITSSTINEPKNLNKLLALNMPYGGMDVSKIIKENWHNASKMIELNNSLCKLLEFGIIPMNKMGVYHCDLKSANILVREEEGVLYTRIIDWGLSTSYKEGEPIPKVLSNRPFQYNVPFSNVIFTTLFTSMYKEFLRTNKNADFYTVRTFVINYILEWIEKRGPGHLKTMNMIIKSLFEKDLKDVEESFKRELIEYDYTFYFIFEYITKILVKFTRDGEFDRMSYFNDVFLHNIDLWGLVTAYIPIIEGIINTHKKATPATNSILNKIKQLILVIIEADDHPINVGELLDKLKALNEVFTHFKKSDVKSEGTSSSNSSISTDEIMEELNTDEKKEVGSSSIHTETRKKVKKRKFHKMIIKTLKNIKSLHSKKAWI
jgi:serine/threonine protein kinase